MFEYLYWYNPDEHYEDYLRVLFDVLYKVYVKICDEPPRNEEIFTKVFGKTFIWDSDNPVIRGIDCLYGLIRFTEVVVNGVKRFDLTLKD